MWKLFHRKASIRNFPFPLSFPLEALPNFLLRSLCFRGPVSRDEEQRMHGRGGEGRGDCRLGLLPHSLGKEGKRELGGADAGAFLCPSHQSPQPRCYESSHKCVTW